MAIENHKAVADAMRAANALMWPGVTPVAITALPTPTLTSTILNVVDAASRAETQARLQATEAKLNEVIAMLNAGRP